MRKICAIFILYVYIVNVAVDLHAQRKHGHEQHFDYSVFAGINFSQIDGDMSNGFSKLGAHFAFNTSIPIKVNSPIRLSVEIGYSQKGSVVDHLNRKITLNYVEVPVLLNYTIGGDKFRMGVGVAPAILTNASVKDGNEINAPLADNYRRFDAIPLLMEIRYKLFDMFALDFRAYDSYYTCAKESGTGTYRISRSNKGQFNRLISFGLTLCL